MEKPTASNRSIWKREFHLPVSEITQKKIEIGGNIAVGFELLILAPAITGGFAIFLFTRRDSFSHPEYVIPGMLSGFICILLLLMIPKGIRNLLEDTKNKLAELKRLKNQKVQQVAAGNLR